MNAAFGLEQSSFVKVNKYNNHTHDEKNNIYKTMLEFDNKFSSTNKSNINLATGDYDLGNKMTINGVSIKNLTNFFASYYYAEDVKTPMIWFNLPEAYVEPTVGYEYTTLFIPAGTQIYDCSVKEDVELILLDDKWSTPFVDCTFKGVNRYNNNIYDSNTKLYKTMLEYDNALLLMTCKAQT